MDFPGQITTEEDWREVYPSLFAAASIRKVDLLGTFAQRVARYGRSSWLDLAEAALQRLQSKRDLTDFDEAISALLGADYDNWEQGITELIGYAVLDQADRLDAVGFPRGGGSPKFEGTVEGRLAFDIKSAVGSGIDMLQSELQSELDRFTSDREVDKHVVRISFSGELTERILGRHCRDARAWLRTHLEDNWPDWERASKDIDGLIVDVYSIEPHAGVYSLSGASPVVSRSVEKTVLEHARRKSKVGREDVDGFVILYVRPPERPQSDINPETLRGLHSSVSRTVAADPASYLKYAGYGLIDMYHDHFEFHGFPVDEGLWGRFGLDARLSAAPATQKSGED